MATKLGISSSQWEKRLLGHARFLAENVLAPDLFDGLAERLAENRPVLFAILNYDRRMQLLPETGARQMDMEDVHRYFNHFAALNPFTGVMKRKQLLNRTIVLSRHFPIRDLVKTEYYNDFMRPRGEKYALSMSLRSSRFGRASLSFYRGDKTGGDFEEEDARRFDALRPFVRNALILRALVRERGEAGRGLESIRDPAFLVSERILRPLNPNGEDFLCARCKAAIPNPYQASFQAGDAEITPIDASGVRGAVVTLPAKDPVETPFDRLRSRFGLTRMEAAVGNGLIDGLTYKEIAEEFGVTPETVHSHVKAIHLKAGVETTRQFIALFLSRR